MDVTKQAQEHPARAMITISFKRAFGFLVAASLLSIIVSFRAPFCSHLPSVTEDVVVYFNFDRRTLFFFCNALWLFLARDSGVLAFFAPANGMHEDSYVKMRIPNGSRSSAVVEGNEKVGVVESLGSSSELENVKCSDLIITSAVKSVETTSDGRWEEAVLLSSDSELDGNGADDEEMDPAEDVEGLQEEHEDLEEFNRRCEEFIARMKSEK